MEEAPILVAVLAGNAELLGGLPLEVELDHYGGLVSYNPSVVSRFDGDGLGRGELQCATIRIPDVDLALGQKTHMCMLAQVSSHDRFHVLRPMETRRVDHALHAAGARPGQYPIALRR